MLNGSWYGNPYCVIPLQCKGAKTFQYAVRMKRRRKKVITAKRKRNGTMPFPVPLSRLVKLSKR
jgi:hypothetical protein